MRMHREVAAMLVQGTRHPQCILGIVYNKGKALNDTACIIPCIILTTLAEPMPLSWGRTLSLSMDVHDAGNHRGMLCTTGQS